MVQNHTPDMGSASSSPLQPGSSTNIDLDYNSEDNDDLTSTINSDKLRARDAKESPSCTVPPISNGTVRSTLQSELQDCSFRSVSSMEYSVDPELRMREAEKLRKQQEAVATNGKANCDSFTVRAVQGMTMDEDYYLIEADEVGSTSESKESGNFVNPREMLGSLDVGALASRLQKLESTPGSGQEGFNRQRSVSSNGNGVDCGEMKIIEIEGGNAHVVKVPIDKAGTAVAWEFRTEPKGIAFGINYKETADSREDVVSLKYTFTVIVVIIFG